MRRKAYTKKKAHEWTQVLSQNEILNMEFENHLAILAMGALEYIERPMLDEEYKKKIEEMIRWKWFFEKTV